MRATLSAALHGAASATDPSSTTPLDPSGDRVRLSLRMTRRDALSLMSAARAAGLPLGAYVAGLVAGIPVLANAASRADHAAALVASSAELATLSRDLRHLTLLLRQGSVQAAREYRQRLDDLDGDVRAHLGLASDVVADLRPRRRVAEASLGSTP